MTFFLIWVFILAIGGMVISLIKPQFLNVLFPFRKKISRKKNFILFSLIALITLFLFNWVAQSMFSQDRDEATTEETEETHETIALSNEGSVVSDPSLQDNAYIGPAAEPAVEDTGGETIIGCMDPNATNYNSAATLNDKEICEYEAAVVLGCTNAGATNYNADATQDDGTCILPSDPCDGVTCSGFGTCDSSSGTAVCNCDVGYTGAFCEIPPATCPIVPCTGANEVCNGGVCECDTGFQRVGPDCIPI